MSKPALENIDLNQFVHNPYNRALSPDLIEETKKHIQDTGEIKPIIYVELDPHTLQEPFNEQKKPLKMVIDGHHRLEALKSLGHKTAPALKATNGLLTSDKTNEVSVEKIKVKKEDGEESNENASSEEPTAMMEAKDVEKYITSSNGKWTVHAESGKHLGTYGSKAEATHRLQQIEYFKHKKMTKADVKKYVQQEGKLWVVRSNDGSRVLGEFRSKDAANMQEELIDNLRATKMSRAEVTTKVQSLAKAWFGESERHADVAAGQNTGLRGSQPKSEIHHGLKTAIKIAALGALAVGGIAALSHPSIRGAIGNAAKSLLHRLPSSKVASSAYKATVEAGGHTVSLTGEIPTARYMFSPYKANEKIIPMKSFHPHHIDNYIKENKHLLTKPNHHLGTWHNKETGNVHLDVSLPHTNRLKALRDAEKHKQLAIFDLKEGKDIPVNPKTISHAELTDSHSHKGMLSDTLMKKEKEINRDAMIAAEHAEHPSLPIKTIEQIADDHIKAGKDLIYKMLAGKKFNKTMAMAIANGLAKVYRNTKPSEDSAQANTQVDIKQVQSIDESLIALYGALREIESVAQNQQTMSEDEIQQIIHPLQDRVALLLNSLKSGTIEESEDTSENPSETQDATDITQDPQRQRKKPYGPKRIGDSTAERELTEPATNFVDKLEADQDISKGFFGFGGGNRGWHGDPEGHAEAARERWEVSGKGKPGEVTPGIHHAVKDVAVKTAKHVGNRVARVAGEAIADIGLATFGAVAGIMILSHLKGNPIPLVEAGKLGLTHLKGALENSMKLAQVAGLKNDVKIARLKLWLAHPEQKLSFGAKAGVIKPSVIKPTKIKPSI